MIPQRNISLIANRLSKQGERRISESVIERDYCIAWFLAALSQAELHKKLVFKGGTVLRRCYFKDYRFSEDLDFTLLEQLSLDDIIQLLEPVFTETQHLSGIRFSFSRPEPPRQNTHTFYILYEGPLPVTSKKEIKVDMTIKELLVFPVEHKKILRSYPEYDDLPDNAKVSVYALEEIASEKVMAVLDSARNEPRDLYDLWYFLEQGVMELDHLLPAIEQKVRFRGNQLEKLKGSLLVKESRYQKLWAARLANQMTVLPPFEEVFRVVKRAFRQLGV